MKKRIRCLISILLSFVMIMGTAIFVSAVEPRYSDTNFVDIQLRISGTTAYCKVNVSGADGTTSISDGHLTLTDSKGNVEEEIDIINSNGKINYIVYDPDTLEIIDFYSVLNPLIVSQWSIIDSI